MSNKPTRAQVAKLHQTINDLRHRLSVMAMERRELVVNPDSENSKLIREAVQAMEERARNIDTTISAN